MWFKKLINNRVLATKTAGDTISVYVMNPEAMDSNLNRMNFLGGNIGGTL